MKAHTRNFKEQIKELGRELDSIITFGDTVLGSSELNAVTPTFQGSILKSVMKELDIDSNVEIPVGTILNYKFGVKVNGEYEYIDFGNYIVKSVERQEDTLSYKIICYDKMLYSMVDYTALNIIYPITIKNYLQAICEHLGLVFASGNDNFENHVKIILNELYLGSDGSTLGYTFRDVLDELAQVTASTICLNENDEVEVRYINETNDTIDEEYLKNNNINFGKKYGKINSIVLSRASESDNVYLKDEESIEENGLCEIKIIDNQIMNGNNRSDFLNDIFEKLNGLEYYLNDFVSTGICYYDVCDRYNVKIGDKVYSCVMFNDEILVTQGLEENIYTEMPKETQTDYTKADKTDRKVNQTYIMVDKQNQEIQALASKVVAVSSNIHGIGEVELENAYEGVLHKLSISGNLSLVFLNSNENIYGHSIVPSQKLTPSESLTPSIGVPYKREILYPNNELYGKNFKIQVDETNYDLDINYLNYMNPKVFDEFINEQGECYIIRRGGIDENGEMYELANEVIEKRKSQQIMVKYNSKLSLLSFPNAILNVVYLTQNDYTDIFAQEVNVQSEIKVATDNINLNVTKKLEDISDEEGNVTSSSIILAVNKDASSTQISYAKISLQGKEINLTGDNTIIKSNNFNVDIEGNMICNNATITGGEVTLKDDDNYSKINIFHNQSDSINSKLGSASLRFEKPNSILELRNSLGVPAAIFVGEDSETFVTSLNVTTPELIQTSRKEEKKNFELFDGALNELLKIDIYKYNLKSEDDTHKKHIGFVIGEDYNYSSEITAVDEEGKEIGVDNYSMTSLCLQAIKEQQQIINELKDEVKQLKESDKYGINRI